MTILKNQKHNSIYVNNLIDMNLCKKKIQYLLYQISTIASEGMPTNSNLIQNLILQVKNLNKKRPNCWD